MKFNRSDLIKKISAFYGNRLRRQLGTDIAQNIENLIFLIEMDGEWDSVSEVAYFLATIGWETAWTFGPIVERRAAPSQTDVRRMQDRYWSTGYFGRGYVQLTWKNNYEKLGKVIGVDLAKNPDELLKPTVSYEVAAIGMRNGLFRSTDSGNPIKLSNYRKGEDFDFVNARNIINGDTDKNGGAIARFAVDIRDILIESLIKSDLSAADVLEVPPAINTGNTSDSSAAIPNNKNNNSSESSLPTQAWEPPITIPHTKPEPTKGPKSLVTTISSIVSGLGISAGTLFTAAQGIIPNLNPTFVIISCLICITLITCTYLFARIYLKNARESRAADIDRQRLEITADPNKVNVTYE